MYPPPLPYACAPSLPPSSGGSFFAHGWGSCLGVEYMPNLGPAFLVGGSLGRSRQFGYYFKIMKTCTLHTPLPPGQLSVPGRQSPRPLPGSREDRNKNKSPHLPVPGRKRRLGPDLLQPGGREEGMEGALLLTCPLPVPVPTSPACRGNLG